MEKTTTTTIMSGLSNLYMTVFLFTFSSFMVIPAITDVTMAAICPGKDECSLAIYLSGIQQTITGVGTLIMMPLIGHLSDVYGRKVMLTVPMALATLPLAILAYDRTKYFYYAYYVIRTLTSMICEGSVLCLALAYVADNTKEHGRASAFGILTGITSCAFVCGNLSTRFLSTSSTFQVAAAVAVISVVYMRVFLPESAMEVTKKSEEECLLEKSPSENVSFFNRLPSFTDTVSLLRNSPTFQQAAVVAFFSTVAELGLISALMYYLKAQFHFDKDQFADLMIINGITGTVSQMLVMPILASVISVERLLSIGLIFSCVHMLLYSFAWTSWVAYAAALFSVLAVFQGPCLRSIASKQVGPHEQGKVQGCLTAISSFASIITPLAFSPLTALFLSEDAPFHFPGFSIMCAGCAMMIAFFQSIMIKATPSIPICKVDDAVDTLEP